jgi:hypothetical protein
MTYHGGSLAVSKLVKASALGHVALWKQPVRHAVEEITTENINRQQFSAAGATCTFFGAF